MTAGWAALLDPLPLGSEALRCHADARGGGLFGLAAIVLGGEYVGLQDAGAGWALIDLSFRITDADTRALAREMARHRLVRSGRRWPLTLRPLAVLTALAAKDAARPVEAVRRQGSPARLARAFWAGAIGY